VAPGSRTGPCSDGPRHPVPVWDSIMPRNGRVNRGPARSPRLTADRLEIILRIAEDCRIMNHNCFQRDHLIRGAQLT
jgi:hypothetical protein